MDKIRKLGAWLWQYKERILLLIVVGVLCWRVYAAINPPEPPEVKRFRPPEDWANVTEEQLPPSPGLQPKTLIPADRKELAKTNPFWYYAGGGGEDGPASVEDLDLTLRGIQSKPDGTPIARVRHKGRNAYYSEGDVIDEQFELVSIDSENGTVTVRAEQFEEPIVLRQE